VIPKQLICSWYFCSWNFTNSEVLDQAKFFVRLGARVRELRKTAGFSQEDMMANKVAPRAITLDDVVKAKLAFDAYIEVKAQRWYIDELAKCQGKPDPPSS
jgi:hypothetical protein